MFMLLVEVLCVVDQMEKQVKDLLVLFREIKGNMEKYNDKKDTKEFKKFLDDNKASFDNYNKELIEKDLSNVQLMELLLDET